MSNAARAFRRHDAPRRWRTALTQLGILAGLFALVGTGAANGVPGPEIKLPPGVSTQAASLVYGASDGAQSYGTPGGLVVAGRDNYDDPAFRQVDAGGGRVLLYLDPVIDATWGRYHQMLIKPSACGPAVPRWPGAPRANSWGHLNDFRPGSVLQGKLECVLEAMVVENPHMSGWFADDVGSRSWFPGFDWSSWDPAMQRAYREGAIALTRTFREVADRHGKIVMVNGTWGGGDLARDGGGYPDAAQHGNALVDGTFVENHDDELAYFGRYACSPQWAQDSKVTRGQAINFAVTRTWAGLERYARSDCFAYANHQPTYDLTAPWTGTR